jgi:hypothetical protein
MFRHFFFCLAGVLCCCLAAAQNIRPEPKMTFLENDELRIGMDLALGGAVTFLSSKGHAGNIINSADLGRQIQMSHYSGPWPFEVGDKKPSPSWAGIGWNPIQTGDCFMNPSTVLECRNDGKEIYLRCVPMQWPLNNVPGDCVFETWTSLERNRVHMRYRCANHRSDKTFYPPCSQELPAVYTVSKLWRLMAYTGDQPFSNAALTRVKNDYRKPWPWTRFVATERWAALVDDADWGVGVFKDDGGEFHGGIYGEGRTDDPKDGSTAYLAPIHAENFDANIVYEHQTDFIVGKLADIRKQCNDLAAKQLPVWRFATDRQHWTLSDAVDQGFPLKGEWRIQCADKIPRINSPVQCWRAESAPGLTLEMAYGSDSKAKVAGVGGLLIRVYWKRLDDDRVSLSKSMVLTLPDNGEYGFHRLNLAASPEYKGLIIGLAMETVEKPGSGAVIRIKSIALSGAEK